MNDLSYKFDITPNPKSIIKVIGVGGGGSNAVNHMYNLGIKDVDFYVCNTDIQALESSPVPNKLQIGVNLTGGLGAGANPEKGKGAAIESKEDIRELLGDGTKMVFITAGMGGGTGTGAAPIIAKVARELDILTVGIVTMPFMFEGRKKSKLADEGILELKNACDTVLVILNDKLREIYGNLTITNAFGQADNILTTAAKGIAEIITVPGYVNVDFEDVKTVMSNAGSAVMGSALANGDNRAIRAAEEAISSPLLNDKDIHGAEKILLSIMSGEQAELQMDELTEITNYIQDQAGDNADVIFGHGVDAELGESISVTVIATGFDKQKAKATFDNKQKIYDLEGSRQMALFNDDMPRQERQPVEPELKKPEPPKEEPQMEQKEEEDRPYVFQRPQLIIDTGDKSDDDVLGNHFIGADKDYEIINEIEDGQQDLFPQRDITEIEKKKEMLIKQSRKRAEELRAKKSNQIAPEQFKDMWDKPAYMRKNVTLNNVPHSSEQNVSRFNLNDDNYILGNNKFLHDNVD